MKQLELRVGQNRKRRVDWDRREVSHKAMELVKRGFSDSLICRLSGLTPGQVAYRKRKRGIGTREYRNGENIYAEVIIRRFFVY